MTTPGKTPQRNARAPAGAREERNPKNNNGEHAPRTAWRRSEGGFEAVADFDWEEFEKPKTEKNAVTLDHLRVLFEEGAKRMELSVGVTRLAKIAGVSEGHAYKALGERSKFATHLRKEGRTLIFNP